MKKYSLIISIITILLQGCDNINNTKNTVVVPNDIKATKDTTVIIPCYEDFIQITSIGNVDIEYTQGEYLIKAIGDLDIINLLDITFDSGIMTVGMLNETKIELSTIKNKQNIKLYVSSPELKYMSICGNGNFKSTNKIKTELFQCGNFSSGSIDIDSLECVTFKFENNDIGNASFQHIKCDNAIVSAFGTTKTSMNLHAQKETSIYIGGNSITRFDVRTTIIDIMSNNNSKGDYNIECSNINVNARNNSSLSIKGTYKQKGIKQEHGCDVKLL